MDTLHARARDRLFQDPVRLERYVVVISRRLRKTPAQAQEWLEAMLEDNELTLVDAVVHGVDVTGRIAYSDEPPRSLEGLTTD